MEAVCAPPQHNTPIEFEGNIPARSYAVFDGLLSRCGHVIDLDESDPAYCNNGASSTYSYSSAYVLTAQQYHAQIVALRDQQIMAIPVKHRAWIPP